MTAASCRRLNKPNARHLRRVLKRFFQTGYPAQRKCRLRLYRRLCGPRFSRAQKLGGKIAVLGSALRGESLMGTTGRTAVAQFAKILNICGDIAGNYGMQIAIEPLRAEECNFINTVAQGIRMCTAAGNPHVKCLADFYHIYMNNEPSTPLKTRPAC